ncbi:MAG: lysylphosphatidylglycerol synthase domain-containing protein, partial [Mobilitalea sp.]
KIFYANRIYPVSATKLVRALFLEHLFDLTVVLLLGFVAIYFRQEIIRSGIVYLLTGIVLVLFLVMISFKGVLLKSPWGDRLNGSSLFRTLSNIFNINMEIRKLFSIVIYTIIIWSFNLFGICYSFNLFFNDIQFSIINAIVLLIIMSLAIAMPSAPAGVGLFEAGIVAYLVYTFNVSNERALASAFLFHLLVTISPIVSTITILSKNKLAGRKF